MTGYQEILTDPSYCRQIVTLTYPHIGNTGTTPEDLESGAVYAAGLVIRDLPQVHSNWRSTESLQSFLTRCKVVAIADIDLEAARRAAAVIGGGSVAIDAGAEKLTPFQVRTSPSLSTMTQNAVVAQDTEFSWPWLSMSPGWVQVCPLNTDGPPSAAMQKLGDTHEIWLAAPQAPRLPDHPLPS